MFSSVLIANRGEIACRIIRTAKTMGLRTIAVHSDADRDSIHVEMADEAVSLGGARAEDSYLRADAILAAAKQTGAACIHPGYGFLAENAGFAEACAMEDIVFVGPPVTAIRSMGRKDEAKALMKEAGVPVLPGYEGDLSSPDSFAAAVHDIGFPLMVKAVAGGGGTGMRRVASLEDLQGALEEAQREAASAFGDARVIIEKCLENPRHIEVQVLADMSGNCVHLFERDCSLQRRHQKVIEEAPAPGMPAELRKSITEAAVSAASAVGYAGAGTVEFLVEDIALTNSSSFYFLEMNTRLQVEHPVTEEVTGRDLVEWQFRVAAGEPLGFDQAEIALNGHSVEARVYGEDPARGFLPSSGKLYLVRWPEGEGIRVEAGVRTDDTVSPFYDPMLAKIIASGANRAEAFDRLADALSRTAIAGPRNNLAFLHDLLARDDVRAGQVDTGLIEREMSHENADSVDRDVVASALSALLQERRRKADVARGCGAGVAIDPWDQADGFTMAPMRPVPHDLLVDGELVPVDARGAGAGFEVAVGDCDEKADWVRPSRSLETVIAGDSVYVLRGPEQTEVSFAGGGPDAHGHDNRDGAVRAPMHGRVVELSVSQGDRVAKGDSVGVLEAMKMEHRLIAPISGTVAGVEAAEGEQVGEGALLLVVADDSDDAGADPS